MTTQKHGPEGATTVLIKGSNSGTGSSSLRGETIFYVDKLPVKDPMTGLDIIDSTSGVPCIGGRARQYRKHSTSGHMELEKLQVRHAENYYTEIVFEDVYGNCVERSMCDYQLDPIALEHSIRRRISTAIYGNIRKNDDFTMSSREYTLDDGTQVTETFNEETGFVATRKTSTRHGLTTETSFRKGRVESHAYDEHMFSTTGEFAGIVRKKVKRLDGVARDGHALYEVASMWLDPDTVAVSPIVHPSGTVNFYVWKHSVKDLRVQNYMHPDLSHKVRLHYRDKQAIIGGHETKVNDLMASCISDPLHPQEFEIDMLMLHFGTSKVVFIPLDEMGEDIVGGLTLKMPVDNNGYTENQLLGGQQPIEQ